jgi:tryptophan-rich sensory protein
MGIAASLVWQNTLDPKQTRNALILFGVQLVLNAFWPFMFFGLKSPLAGLITISILAAAILLTIQRFLGVSRMAGILLIPYFLWVSFASGLNLSIWYLNC